MSEFHQDNRGENMPGAIFGDNAQVTVENIINNVRQQVTAAAADRKNLLDELVKEVERLIKELPADKKEEAPQVAENLEMAVKQATSEKPNRKWYSVSAEGLLEAATWVKDFSGAIGGTLLNLGKAIWSDFKL